jgi:hypothetical protein
MTRYTWLGVIIAGSLAIAAPLLAQGFGIRTGSWSMTLAMKGDLSMEGVPPETRAAIEAELRKPNTFTSCVTKQRLEDLNLGKTDDSDDEDCEVVSRKITATAADITRRCEGDEPRTETSHFDAATLTTLKATITRTDATGTSTMNLTGKWLSGKCAE